MTEVLQKHLYFCFFVTYCIVIKIADENIIQCTCITMYYKELLNYKIQFNERVV